MTNRHVFSIPFVGLKHGEHEFLYSLKEEFFIEKGAVDFDKAEVNIKLTLEKNTGFMLLKFDVDGSTAVTCDRCGNPLMMNLWDEFNILVKMAEDPDKMNIQEEDPDVFYIGRNDSHLEVSDWLYEFALLSVPVQRMCSAEEMGGSQCNKEVLDKLNEMSKTEESNANKLWKDLSKFKDN